jgi:2-polyprenyl-3-methyl-5-hydroxy-6-metoxy-1,4-benzoquinol methylase
MAGIDKAGVQVALDWGCGGGILTKELGVFAKTIAADICKDSLENCKIYASPDHVCLIPNDLSEFKYTLPKPDLILAHAIVWHFPSLEYFKTVLGIWADINPRYIALNTKKLSGKRFTQADNYTKNFLNALCFSDALVIELFNGAQYSLLSSIEVTTGAQPQTYFVFQR